MKRLTLLSARLVSLVRPLALAAAAVAISAGVGLAEEKIEKANRLFGQAVHLYYAGNFEEAAKLLDESLEAGDDRDPRPYYFRGLARYKMDQKEEAKADFEKGAKIEASDVDFPQRVNYSLQKVQGKVRVLLEEFRIAGKAETRDHRAEARAARLKALAELEKRVVETTRGARPAPVLRYNREFNEEPGDLDNIPLPEEAGEAEASSDAVPVAPREEMSEEKGISKPAVLKEEMTEDATPALKLEADEPAAPAAKNDAASTGTAPGRVGRLFGIFTKPIQGAVDATAKGAAGLAPGVGGPPPNFAPNE